MDAALSAALTIAGDADSPFATLPAYDLRQRMAALIAREAATGVADIDILKASALRRLAATLADRNDGRELISKGSRLSRTARPRLTRRHA